MMRSAANLLVRSCKAQSYVTQHLRQRRRLHPGGLHRSGSSSVGSGEHDNDEDGDDGDYHTSHLHDFHVARGAVFDRDGRTFHRWRLPLHYGDGVHAEHRHVRTACGLSDVSHLTPVRLFGRERAAFAEHVTTADVRSLPLMTGAPALVLHGRGGILEATTLTAAGHDHLLLLSHAGHAAAVVAHLERYASVWHPSVRVLPCHHDTVLDLQGPTAAATLSDTSRVETGCWRQGDSRLVELDGVDCFVTRTGYSGEDGFRIMIRKKPEQQGGTCTALQSIRDKSRRVAAALLDRHDVRLVGLGCRETLRLEAGLSLLGVDVGTHTTPLEAGVRLPDRRLREGGFLGHEVVKQQSKDGTQYLEKVRVGIVTEGPPGRGGDLLFHGDAAVDDRSIGSITSGAYGPWVKHNVALGYVPPSLSRPQTKLTVEVRGKRYPAVVKSLPFL